MKFLRHLKLKQGGLLLSLLSVLLLGLTLTTLETTTALAGTQYLTQVRSFQIYTNAITDQQAVWGWSSNDFFWQYNHLASQGYRLVHQQAYDIGGQITYDGVWNRTNTAQKVVWGWTQNDFNWAYNTYTAQGYRLSHIQAYRAGGGQILFDGIFDISNVPQEVIWGWAKTDFNWKYTDMVSKGYRLFQQQEYDIGGGQIRYNAIFNKSTIAQQVLWDWSSEDFFKRESQLNQQGYRIADMQIISLDGSNSYASLHYSAIFNLGWGETDRVFAINVTPQSEAAAYAGFHGSGKRLVMQQRYLVTSIVTPPPPPPPPPPTTTPIPTSKPVINVSSSGTGGGAKFTITGSKFLTNHQVNIRVVDGNLITVYYYGNSDGSGNLNKQQAIPCNSGLPLYFSANDGRSDPNDLTGTLWSNTVTISCP